MLRGGLLEADNKVLGNGGKITASMLQLLLGLLQSGVWGESVEHYSWKV